MRTFTSFNAARSLVTEWSYVNSLVQLYSLNNKQHSFCTDAEQKVTVILSEVQRARARASCKGPAILSCLEHMLSRSVQMVLQSTLRDLLKCSLMRLLVL